MRKIALLLFTAAFAVAQVSSGLAAVSSTPVFVQTPKNNVVQFLQGTDSAGTYKTLVTAGSNGTKCTGMFATSSDGSAAHLVTVQFVRSTVKYGGVAVNVPVNSGFANGTPPVNLMTSGNWAGLPVDSDGNPYFHLESGDTLQATFATALTASTAVNIIAVCADF